MRFKIQAKGPRLIAGVNTLAVGVLVTALVILSGSSATGFQDTAWISWDVLWHLLQLGLLVLAAAAVYGIFTVNLASLRWGLGVTALALTGVLFWSLVAGVNTRFSDASMRILFQLTEATLAGLVLLAGCVLIFKKRAGIVLLHSGIGLMMASEVLVGVQAEEAQMRIEEGHSMNYVEDIRTAELAFVAATGEKEETHTVVPARLLTDGARITDAALPVDLKVLRYVQNANIVGPAMAPEETRDLATAGAGLTRFALPVRPTAGTDMGGGIDNPAAYVQLTEKGSGRDLGTYLVSTQLDLFDLGENPQSVQIGDKTCRFGLRFERTYKPYTVTLNDIRKEDYIGTDTPRDYSSFIQLVDREHGTDREVRIWMNNPLRYSGETFYQSSYTPANAIYSGSKEWTTLQVVKNTGWMIPYVACMIVVVGMIAQFGTVLVRFLRRRERGLEPEQVLDSEDAFFVSDAERKQSRRQRKSAAPEKPAWDVQLLGWLVPTLVVVTFGGYLLSKARLPAARNGEMDLVAFGKIPVVYEGRPKPIDTLARNSLLVISDRQEMTGRMDEATMQQDLGEIKARLRKKWKKLSDSDLAGFKGNYAELPALVDAIKAKTGASRYAVDEAVYAATSEEQPAVKWLLDVITDAEASRQHRVFRIENLELLQTLGLERRDGFRYSIEEFSGQLPKYMEQLREAEELGRTNEAALTFYQRKLLEFRTKLQTYQKLQSAFVAPNVPAPPTAELVKTDPDQARQQLAALISAVNSAEDDITHSNVPLSMPVSGAENAGDPNGKWIPFSIAVLHAYVNSSIQIQFYDDDPRETTLAFHSIVGAYEAGNPGDFNAAVKEYSRTLSQEKPKGVNAKLIGKEVFFNYFAPFYYSAAVYVVAFVLTCLSWLGFTRTLSRSAFWLMVFVLCVHSWAIIMRMQISGRPPVTNLYSSAVFIGWAAVLFGLVLEWVYRLGVGNIIASVAGFVTLGIAHLLSGDGDTFTVLQAVLDTQFWLATHVVCITLGYATTYVSGLLGLVYVLRGVGTKSLSAGIGKDLTRMIYGTLCFAIVFSFFGTVLGGLWADDSWGRFWGWDPKENGALMIVLWNALVLHARWDGLVKDRGLAVLAVLGNIAVSWSWFGVNELGVGLHSYGFTEGVLLTLGLFCLSQLVIAGAGCLPRSLWFSRPEESAAAT
jgi:ABC-type transport system involved in cytochrome c biogenesis permease subunit